MGEEKGLRLDFFSGSAVWVVNQSAKPFPAHQALFPAADPCPLCAVVANASDGVTTDGGQVRKLVRSSPFVVSLLNRFPVFAPPAGVSVLHAARDHVLSPADLSPAAWQDLCAAMTDTEALVRAAEYSGVPDPGRVRDVPAAAFMNVGVQAGASLSHLHAQTVAAVDADGLQAWFPREDNVDTDYQLAVSRGQCLTSPPGARGSDDGQWSAWVPVAPVAKYEVRVRASSLVSLALGVYEVLRTWRACSFDWAFNVFVFAGPVPCAQLLPATDFGRAYPVLFGVNVAAGDLSEYANRLNRVLRAGASPACD